MPIDPLPQPPRRDDAANFAARADAFLGALPDFQAQANALADDVEADADRAEAAAATAINAPGTSATSTTSLDLSYGTKTPIIQTGKAFAKGQTVVLAQTSAPLNQMQGIITAYNSGTGALTVAINSVSGTATGITDWTISIAAPVVFASAADIRAGTDANKVVTPKAMYDALEAVVDNDLSGLNMAEWINLKTTLTANSTLPNPTNIRPGKSGRIEIRQDATGGRTLSFASYWKFAGGVALSPSTAANARDIYYYDAISDTEILLTSVKAIA